MTLDKIFYIYMAAIGLIVGTLLVQVPAVRDFWIPPFFWLLLAVGLFEVGNSFVRRGNRVLTLTNISRGIGFGIALALMVAVTLIAGVTVRYV